MGPRSAAAGTSTLTHRICVSTLTHEVRQTLKPLSHVQIHIAAAGSAIYDTPSTNTDVLGKQPLLVIISAVNKVQGLLS